MFHLPDMGIDRAPFTGRFLIAGTPDGFSPSDHGTMIASILLDWCPNAYLYSYRVASDLDDTLTSVSKLLNAFDLVIGTVQKYPKYRHIVSVSQAVAMVGEQKERYRGQIQKLAELGALTVCAAGNDGAGGMEKYPAVWPEPVCVTACDSAGSRAEFSTVLGEADCCAWGKNVPVTGVNGRTVASGTSYACPQVAGMAGMVWQDGMTAADVWMVLRTACVDTGAPGLDPYYGWGVIDPTRLRVAETVTKEEPVVEEKAQTKAQRFYDAALQALGGLYVWGGQGHKATEAYIRGRARQYPQYFTGGRLEMMLRTADEGDLRCWDCSGLVCWALTEAGLQKAGFDTTANGLYQAYCTPIKKEELQTGDLLFRKSGSRMVHVGIYGTEGCIEAAGGAYGVVLCKGLSGSAHAAKSLVDGKTHRLPDWTHYGRLQGMEETNTQKTQEAAFGLTTGNVHVRTEPGAQSASKGVLKKGNCILVASKNAGWQRCAAFLNGAVVDGYVSEKYVEVKQV